ncbi:MAG: prolyl-tRNA synthetase associated domain-containing protein [Promethearchaeota archaeon]
MEESLKQWLKDHNIQYILYTHPPVFTVPEAREHCGQIPGTHCKNLFLKNKKTEQLYLVTLPQDKQLDLKIFRKIIGASKVRFASSEDLFEMFGVSPGAVSPIGLVNDIEDKVIFIVDENIWNAKEICCHPNVNNETLQVPRTDFHKLIEATNTTIKIMNLPYSES